jgi:hypothetical protein
LDGHHPSNPGTNEHPGRPIGMETMATFIFAGLTRDKTNRDSRMRWQVLAASIEILDFNSFDSHVG